MARLDLDGLFPGSLPDDGRTIPGALELGRLAAAGAGARAVPELGRSGGSEMSAVAAWVVSKFGDGSAGPVRLGWRCVGCGEAHLINVGPSSPQPSWEWNGSRSSPTLSPSIRVRFHRADAEVVCHSFVRDGVVEFLSDCTHDLAGRKVPMRFEESFPFGPPDDLETNGEIPQ